MNQNSNKLMWVSLSYYQIYKEAANTYLLIYVTIMYRGTKFVILNFCTFDIFSILNEGSKNLYKSSKEQSLNHVIW